LPQNSALETLRSKIMMNEAEKDKVLSICARNNGKTLTTALQTFMSGAPWFKALPTENQEVILSALAVAAVSTLRGTGMILSAIDSGLLPKDEFHTDILLNGTPKTLPPWLTENGRRILRSKASALSTFQGKEIDLTDVEDKFDFVSLSNIYDFSKEEVSIKNIKDVAATILKPGGELLVRRAVGNAPGILEKAGGKVLEGESLENYDYNSLFYRSVGTVASAKFRTPARDQSYNPFRRLSNGRR